MLNAFVIRRRKRINAHLIQRVLPVERRPSSCLVVSAFHAIGEQANTDRALAGLAFLCLRTKELQKRCTFIDYQNGLFRLPVRSYYAMWPQLTTTKNMILLLRRYFGIPLGVFSGTDERGSYASILRRNKLLMSNYDIRFK